MCLDWVSNHPPCCIGTMLQPTELPGQVRVHFLIYFLFKIICLLLLYFIDYAITVVLTFPPLSPSTHHSLSLMQSPHHCSCPWVMCISSLATLFPILYFISPWLLCNYLFVLLNPLTSSSIPLYLPPSGNHQNALGIHDSVSVLVCLLCFLVSIVDEYLVPFYCSYVNLFLQ